MNDLFFFTNGCSSFHTDKGEEKTNLKHWAIVYGEYLESQKIDPLKVKIHLPTRSARYVRKGKKLDITFEQGE